MVDINYIRENREYILNKYAQRGAKADIDAFLRLDDKRRQLLQKTEQLRYEKNTASQNVAAMKRKGDPAEQEIVRLKDVSQSIKKLEKELRQTQQEISDQLLGFPNIPHDSVPAGVSEADNALVRSYKEIPHFDFEPKPHHELGQVLGILDFERAGKISGSRFCLYMGAGALLERALINFMLNTHTTKHGYTEVLTPYMVNADSMRGTGQLPKFEEDLFKIESDGYYLIPTAEVPVTNIYRNEILAEADLPIYYVCYSACFRREAGSYGQDTQGIIRQHQFNKVELVKFSAPEASYNELEKLLSNAEQILKLLDLPYRVVSLCTGDLGFSAAKTYDIEVWLPSQNKYREISSCSNFEDFQARRAKIRYRPKAGGKPVFVHTLNGSGLAVGRTVVAIMENYQQPDGSIVIPDILRAYMGGMEKIV